MVILLILVSLVFAEYCYSLSKKDSVYSFTSLRVNFITQLFGTVKDIFIPALGVIGLTLLVHSYIPQLFSIPQNMATFLAAIVLMDFLYYVFHRLNHKVWFLWMFHFVHHSDTNFNLSVGFRSSWFEMAGLFIFYSPVLLLGFPLPLFLLAFVCTSTYQFITHTYYLRLPRFLTYVFVTPSFHMTHHDVDVVQQNSNFGGVFSFWDRLGSTYEEKEEAKGFGIEGYTQDHFIKIHTDPILSILGKKIRSWKSKATS